MIKANDVQQIIQTLVFQYNIEYDRQDIAKSSIFTIEKFGTKVVYLDGKEFSDKVLKGWHIAWVIPDFSVNKAKTKVVQALMRGGYFHYLRLNHKRTFQQALTIEGWDRTMRKFRETQYNKHPKYNYWKEYNDDLNYVPTTEALAKDPSCYDTLLE